MTLDDYRARELATRDPLSFFSTYGYPAAVDEAQLVPELFRQVKYTVDQSEERGMVVLTGSQTYQLMQGVSESLAGRVGILEMSGLSLRELAGSIGKGAFVPVALSETTQVLRPEGFDLWAHIQRGNMSALQDQGLDWDAFCSDFVRAYIERDVRQLINLRDELKFKGLSRRVRRSHGAAFQRNRRGLHDKGRRQDRPELALRPRGIRYSEAHPPVLVESQKAPREDPPSSSSWTPAWSATSSGGRVPIRRRAGRWQGNFLRPSWWARFCVRT